MSQAGKVLHVYMEVRSVPEDGGKMLEQEDNGSGNLGLPCLEFLPDFQKSFAHCSPNCNPDHSPITKRHSGCGNRSVTPSKSPSSSRHMISFQLQNPDSTGSPTQYQRQDLVDDNFAELLRLISPEGSSPDHHGSLGPTHSSGKNSYKERGISPNFAPSQRLSVPNTPTSNLRSPQHQSVGDEEGKTSVVTFGYIEKSNVHSIGNRSSSVCQTDLHGPLNRPKDLQKRLSDPMWYTSHPAQGDNNYPYRLQSPRGSTCMQRTTLNTIARDPTHTDFETFGSPELKRLGDDRPERFSPRVPRAYQSPRCRSLEASPNLPRNALTLPSQNKTWDLDRGVFHGSLNGLPRSPASEHLCGHTGISSYLAAPGTTVSPHGPHRIRSLTEDQSPRLSRKYHSTLPAGRPTDIQNDFQTNKPPSSNQAWFSYQGSRNSPCGSSHHSINDICECSRRNHSKPSYCTGRNSDSLSPSSGRRIVSPSSNAEMAYKLAMEATRLSPNYKHHLTASPTPSQAESQRSFLSESQLTLQRCHSPETLQMKNHRHQWQTEQNTQSGSRQGSLSPLRSHRGLSSPTSPALPARRHRAAASQSPVLDPGLRISSPSKHTSTLHQYQNPQYTRDSRQSGVDCRQFYNLYDRSHSVYSSQYDDARPSKQEASWRNSNDKSFQNPFQGNQRSCPTEEIEGQCRAAGNDSQSSSGVTGSFTDSSQQFPETSSQSSYDTTDTGSGIQTDNGLATTATTRSQKIARAKWEFLFGSGRTEEDHCDTQSTTPPTGDPPTSTPPSSWHLMPPDQRKGWNSKGQRSSKHKVRQIELELVTPNLRGFSPKTGIIRRTIKYSETDLDAVPLRCYRETDLDEVMRAEAEEVEADSAFSSNRSVLEISSFSPADISPKPWNGGGKGRHEEEEEEDDEQEEGGGGVVSWASVRMLGDKQRQQAAKEEEEVFSLLLKGPLESSCEANSALKSPISVSSPRLSESNLDSFSRHFENIMESHRAKGTSYSSLDSVDLLTSGSTSVFTFDLPTLTPEIQSQICDSAKQIIELSFAPLVLPDSATAASAETSRSETTLNAGGGIQNGEKDDSSPRTRMRSEKDSWRRTNAKDGVRKANSAPSLHSSPRERPVNPPLELLYPQADVAERLALGGSDDALPNGTSADLQAAKRLAKRLFHLDGFRKSDVARHLSKNNEFSQRVAEEYLSNFNFSGLTIDQALRSFLNRFALIGETQERERVLAHFSRRYGECNTDTTEDSVHTLTCAVMLLNSDLHGNNIGKRMSCNQFITNLEGLNNGKDFPKDLLKTLYSSIKNEKLQWTIDEEEVRKTTMEQGDVRTDAASHTMKRLGSSGNPLMGVAQQADGEVYKSGFLVRKVHADPDGKRTPRGKRSWKSFYAMLKGLVLYLQKDEYRSERELTEEDLKNSVSIHHSLAMRAVDYSKRPNVFYLRTADWRVFLLQAPNAEQMQSWITRINVVAAMFSAPPFPAAIGSQKRFSRPLLPGSNTKLSQEEQLKSHENRFRAVSSELAELMASAADLKSLKGRELEEHKQRLEYLEFEKTRYGTYAMLLRAKLSCGDQDLEAFESRLFDDGGLQRAHSSPSLPQDTANKEKIRGTKTSKSLKVMSSSTSSTTKTTGGEDGKKNGNNTQSEPRKQSIKQEEAA